MKDKRQTPTPNKPGGGRKYTPRPCAVCNADASYSLQTMVRTIGRGQSGPGRKVKMGATVLLCDKCTRRPHSFTDELVAAVTPTIDLVRAPRPNSGPGLFAAPHGRRGDYQAAQA